MTQLLSDRDDPKIVVDNLNQMELYHKMTLQVYLHSSTLLFFLHFNVFGRMHNRPSKIIAFYRVLACDPGPELESKKKLPTTAPIPTPAKTVDSDRLQLSGVARISSKGGPVLRGASGPRGTSSERGLSSANGPNQSLYSLS